MLNPYFLYTMFTDSRDVSGGVYIQIANVFHIEKRYVYINSDKEYTFIYKHDIRMDSDMFVLFHDDGCVALRDTEWLQVNNPPVGYYRRVKLLQKEVW